MQTTVREWAEARLRAEGLPNTEANRIGLAIWRGSISSTDEPAELADAIGWPAADALAACTFTRRVSNDAANDRDETGAHNEDNAYVSELGELRQAFVVGANPFAVVKALHNLGVDTGVTAIDGDFPTTDDDGVNMLDAEVELDDDEAAVLGLTDAAGGISDTGDDVAVPAGGEPFGRVESAMIASGWSQADIDAAKRLHDEPDADPVTGTDADADELGDDAFVDEDEYPAATQPADASGDYATDDERERTEALRDAEAAGDVVSPEPQPAPGDGDDGVTHDAAPA